MRIAAYLREPRIERETEARRREYAGDWDEASRKAFQLETFNNLWRGYRERIPFYRELVESGQAPETFNSWEQFADVMPVVDRPLVQSRLPDLTDPSQPPDKHFVTGGSTTEPVSIPGWKHEVDLVEPNRWYGRDFYGIRPSDKMFMIWGHRHLLGTGLQFQINWRLRLLKDRLLGYERHNAYKLNKEAARHAADRIATFKPGYVLGYSSSLELLGRANEGRTDLRDLGIKCSVGCAEPFPSELGPEKISTLLNAPSAMEYGSIEAGIVAHTHPDGGYRVFWRTYMIEATHDGPGGGKQIYLTSLTPRCFPMVRYAIGDEIKPTPGEPAIGPARWEYVIGRANAYLEFPSGEQIHSVGIAHCIDPETALHRFQIIDRHGAATIRLVAPDIPADERKAIEGRIYQRLHNLNPILDDTPIEWVEQLFETRAGKVPIVVSQKKIEAETSGT
ncbi:MAG: hypothetical protein AAGD00_09590 [Planctomycetota bacterium]